MTPQFDSEKSQLLKRHHSIANLHSLTLTIDLLAERFYAIELFWAFLISQTRTTSSAHQTVLQLKPPW